MRACLAGGAVNALNIYRTLFGVDYPFASNERGIAWLDAAPISGADRKKIYETNARRVFRIS